MTRFPEKFVITLLLFFVFFRLELFNDKCFAEEPQRLYRAKQILEFGDFLGKRGEYYRAITEYERFLSFAPQSPLANLTRNKILRSYYFGKAFIEGAKWSGELASLGLYWDFYGNYYSGIFLYHGKEYKKARKKLQELRTALPILPDQAIFLDYRLFWVHLEMKNFDKSQERIESMELVAGNLSLRDHKKTEIYLGKIRAMKEGLSKIKNVPAGFALAGAFSSAILPGSGQALNGRYSDGFFSLLTIGILTSLTVLSFSKNEDILGFGLGGITLLFYTANIYGGYTSGQRQQRILYNKALIKLKQRALLPPEFIN